MFCNKVVGGFTRISLRLSVQDFLGFDINTCSLAQTQMKYTTDWTMQILSSLSWGPSQYPGLAPSQWETPLQSNSISHWLGTNLESALISTKTYYHKILWSLEAICLTEVASHWNLTGSSAAVLQGTYQISKCSDNSKYKSCGFRF